MSDEKKHEDMLEINRIWLGEGNEDDKLYTIFQYTQKIRTQRDKEIIETIEKIRQNNPFRIGKKDCENACHNAFLIATQEIEKSLRGEK